MRNGDPLFRNARMCCGPLHRTLYWFGSIAPMNHPLHSAALLLSAIALSAGCAHRAPAARVATKIFGAASDARTEERVRAAHDSFYAALNSMFVGDLGPMNAVWAHDDDVTDQGPFGGRTVGWDAVSAHWNHKGSLMLGGKVTSEDVLVRCSDTMAYTVCVEHGEHMDADNKTVDVRFRATSVFRLQDGEWKLVHHHTDHSVPLQAAFIKN